MSDRNLLLQLALVGSVTSMPVFAQTADEGLEEVIVTAQKREASLQDTPVAITALGADTIERLNIQNITDFSNLAPNVQFLKNSGVSTSATVAIRGAVTINPAITLEPTVGVYMDGVFIGKSFGSIFDVADLERVEVLRGPQGTLYGKNTLGGAVNMISKRPSGEFGGKVKAGVGSDSYWNAKVDLDLPALDLGGAGSLKAKIAYQQSERDGFYDNVSAVGFNPASSDEFNDLDSGSGRIALLWDISESFSAYYSYDFSRISQRPTFFQLTSVLESVPLGNGAFVNTERADEGSNDGPLRDDADVDGHGLTLSWQLSDNVALKSITGYREFESLDGLDLDGSPLRLAHFSRDVEYEQFSQELQLVGSSERINYVAGLYYFAEEGTTLNPQFIDFAGQFDSRYGLDNDAWAVYGQVDFNPIDRLTLSLGARYTEESKIVQRSLSALGFPTVPADAPFVVVQPLPAPLVIIPQGTEFDEDFDNTSFTVIADYQLMDDVNVYAKYAQGWKSGGFNAESSNITDVANPFEAEDVDSYELGFKSRFVDNKVQLNAAAFWNAHTDMQLSIFLAEGAAESIFQNAGEADINGFELEAILLPTANLLLEFGYGYLDASYDEFVNSGVDVSDTAELPYTPQNSWNFAAQYTTDATSRGQFFARVDFFATDEYVGFPQGFEPTRTSSYELVSATLGWRGIPFAGDTTLDLLAWGKNLGDEEYTVNGIDFVLFAGNNFGDPRTYGVDVIINF